LLKSGIYANIGGVVKTIADSTSKEFNFFGSSAVNDAGTIAFFANFGAGESGIFTSSNGKIAPVVSTQDAFSSFVAGINTVGGDGPFAIYTVPGINNSGKIAFSASLKTGKSGVFVSDGGTVKTIADTNSIFNRFSSAAINDRAQLHLSENCSMAIGESLRAPIRG